MSDSTELFWKTTEASTPEQLSAASDGQSLAVDPVEAALADALRRASEVGQWAVVAELARELQTRREASAGVTQIADARKRRDRS